MQHSIPTINRQTISVAYLKELQKYIDNFCRIKLAHPDKKTDSPLLLKLQETAATLNLTSDNLLSELSCLLHAVQLFINQTTTVNGNKRYSNSELINWLQKECEKIEECQMNEITAVSCALENLQEHADYSSEDILQRRKWGLTHASELHAAPALFDYWLKAVHQISIDVAVPSNYLTRCDNNILRHVGGLVTGYEAIMVNYSPEDFPLLLGQLPIHFNHAILRHADKLYYFEKSSSTVINIFAHDRDLELLECELGFTDQATPVTPAMLKRLHDVTSFNLPAKTFPSDDFNKGIQYFSPRNILVALVEGIFNYFEPRSADNKFQIEMIEVLSALFEKGVYQHIINEIADLIDDPTYSSHMPSNAFLESLMRIGYATTADELKAIREACRPVMDDRGIELSKEAVNSIINHTPGKPDTDPQPLSGQVHGGGIICAPTTTINTEQSEFPVQARDQVGEPNSEDKKQQTVVSSSSSMLEALKSPNHISAPTPVIAESEDDEARDAKLNEIFTPAYKRWKPWQQILFGIAIGIVVSAILVGIAAALLYAGPLAHVALAAGVAATVHWAAAIGVAGVVGTLAGIPVVGAAVGFITGLFWNHKTNKEMKTNNAAYVPPEQLPIQKNPNKNKKPGCCGCLWTRKPNSAADASKPIQGTSAKDSANTLTI